jgi:hypothetical protein
MVADKTGLAGNFEWTLEFAPDPLPHTHIDILDEGCIQTLASMGRCTDTQLGQAGATNTA